ncbi:MAG: precorrin-2 C(20)-methyltransferase [Desulfovibrionales bacterium]|nr:precorrin-2 C(20)-methyltransferase [Desulfovibrionales bacterium]
MNGHLYGIGVGPGDPDLITVKAVRVLHEVDLVLAAASTKNEDSLALEIARPHLRPDTPVLRLGFPMSRDPHVLRQAWQDNARLVLDHLYAGKNTAFLTLGDPLLYSTFAYVLRTVRQMDPDQPITVIPGITSFQAAASATQTVLAEGAQNLLILPGIREADNLRTHLGYADNAVVLKAYTNFSALRAALHASPVHKHCVFASRLGLADQMITHDLDHAPENPTYLSLLLLTALHPNPEENSHA